VPPEVRDLVLSAEQIAVVALLGFPGAFPLNGTVPSWVGAQLELRLRAGLKLDDLVADEDLDGCGPAGA
jgi:hypothetical protein